MENFERSRSGSLRWILGDEWDMPDTWSIDTMPPEGRLCLDG